MLLVIAMTTTTFAMDNFTWLQSTGEKVINLGTMNPSPNGIRFFCVATSPKKGSYSAKLQRNVLWGFIWVDVGPLYRCEQCSQEKYNPMNGRYVNGQPSLLTWPTNECAEYRIVLSDASAPQSTVFTEVDVW